MMIVRHRLTLLVSVIVFGIDVCFAQSLPPADPKYQPTNVSLRLWADDGEPVGFNEYLSTAHDAISRSRWVIEGESATQRIEHVRLISPAEWRVAFDKKRECTSDNTEGVLLLHGLTDTPFLMRDLGDFFAARKGCFVIRSILLPGHGTGPGDMSRAQYEDWAAATKYGINQFKSVARRVHLVGFSTGGALSIYWAYKRAELDVPIASLVLFSPAIRPTGFLLRTKILPHVLGYVVRASNLGWTELHDDQDFAKYESFNLFGGFQIYRLDEEIEKLSREALDVPVFMAVSRSDSTINAIDSINFFLTKTGPSSRMMLVAPDRSEANVARALHDSRVEYFSAQVDKAVINFAHLSFVVRPDNPHYGRNGDYANCLPYDRDSDREKYCSCITPSMLQNKCYGYRVAAGYVYGEHDKKSVKEHVVRRLTFNPYFSEMATRIDRFIESIK